MSGQCSDFLAAQSQRVADVWQREIGPANPGQGRGPQQLINAVLVALTADDLHPLLAYYELDGKTDGVNKRLETALRHLEALARAVATVAGQEGLAAPARLELALGCGDDLAAISRRLATTTTTTLADQLATLNSRSVSKGTSLSITMHELRRPLTILNSYCQLLTTGMLGPLPESASVAIEGITSSTEMMIRLVSALSELSRLEDPDDKLALEEMSIAAVVTASVDTMATEVTFRECTIETDVDASVRITADRRRMTLAVTNILSNALKHSPAGGVVKIRAFGDGAEAHIVVRDQGPGFPPDDAPHLFDKYFRSTAERHRKIPGSGLGLYIVKTVAERHNGRVEARSESGHGAEFEIVVPVHKAKR